ncbi:MAG: hypothetical protein LBI15_08795 [Dysgonamonadaceae bacterium]|jgi:hypothetical protein|nr:hypothetical protein [Dysgonamonadaceae bacterium]
MRKLNENQMLEVSGGAKCIYHGLMLLGGFGPIHYLWNLSKVVECWNNEHPH